MILAPLRGVTIRAFRTVFSDVLREAGFTEAVTPFVTAIAGYDPLADRELKSPFPSVVRVPSRARLPSLPAASPLPLTPQFIGKDPVALEVCLEKVRAAGFEHADLNAGCPYPMVRSKGRGSGLLRTPDVLRRMLETGCGVMGDGNFSLKARLGVERKDELLKLMPMINAFPLRRLVVHARTARQMYGGQCDRAAFEAIRAAAKMPVVYNGDVPFPPSSTPAPVVRVPHAHASPGSTPEVMIGRSFIVWLGTRPDIGELLRRYIDYSVKELAGDASVLGRMKELIAYWKLLPEWHRRWNLVKITRTTDELLSLV